jgi:hypothetical protein
MRLESKGVKRDRRAPLWKPGVREISLGLVAGDQTRLRVRHADDNSFAEEV